MIYISGQVRCKLQAVTNIVSKQYELWSTNGFKLLVSFYTPSVISAFHFIATLRRRRSANGTQPNFAKRWTVDRANNPPGKGEVVSPEKNGGQKCLHLFGFSTTSGLNGKHLLMKRDIENRPRALESTQGLLRCPKIP